MSFTVIIPSRYASTRLPGKPLAEIAGKPMIQHVWEKAKQSSASEVIIATDHEDILKAAQAFGADVVLTSDQHVSGTDRLQEVCAKKQYGDDHVVINLQGDEPLFPPEQIDLLYKNISENDHAGIATLCCKIESWKQVFNPNVVKVVRDNEAMALYFSRTSIPWHRDLLANCSSDNHGSLKLSSLDDEDLSKKPVNSFRHLGIYAYRVNVLNQFVEWPASELEKLESLEQLRAMENGVRIHCAEASYDIPEGVDTEEDLQRVREILHAN